MYVADVASGRITRKLVETTSDPHFDSLQFIASAGDWAPDNRRFAFAALHAGQPVLTIIDTRNGNARRDERAILRDLTTRLAGRQADRLLGAQRRRARSVCLHAGERRVATTHQRSVCRSRSRVVAQIVWVTDRFSSTSTPCRLAITGSARSTSRRGMAAGRLRDGPHRILSSAPTARCIATRTASPTCIGFRMRCSADRRPA